ARRPVRRQAPVESRELRSARRASAAPEAEYDHVTSMLGEAHVATRYGMQRKVRRFMRQERICSVRQCRRTKRDCDQPQPPCKKTPDVTGAPALHCAFRPLQAQEVPFALNEVTTAS